MHVREVEVIPGRFFWRACERAPVSRTGVFSFNIDASLVYEPFFADFGPLNLGATYRYCRLVEKYLHDPRLAKKKIVHYCSLDPALRANSAVLVMLYQIVVLKKSAADALKLFAGIEPQLMPYRDASGGHCSFKLRAEDVVRGMDTAIRLGWFHFDTFDILEYEHHEKVENGDLSWIVPGKFIAFAGPHPQPVDEDGFPVYTPESYVPYFQRVGVQLVLRLNNATYDAARFVRHGIAHEDLFFVDGSCPSAAILARFFRLAEEHATVAIHCKAGLGRTGTLIGLWCMKEVGFEARAFIGWNRLCRPGSILGPQQQFLVAMEQELKSPAKPRLLGLDFGLNLLEPYKPFAYADAGQGERLCDAKRAAQTPKGAAW